MNIEGFFSQKRKQFLFPARIITVSFLSRMASAWNDEGMGNYPINWGMGEEVRGKEKNLGGP